MNSLKTKKQYRLCLKKILIVPFLMMCFFSQAQIDSLIDFSVELSLFYADYSKTNEMDDRIIVLNNNNIETIRQNYMLGTSVTGQLNFNFSEKSFISAGLGFNYFSFLNSEVTTGFCSEESEIQFIIENRRLTTTYLSLPLEFSSKLSSKPDHLYYKLGLEWFFPWQERLFFESNFCGDVISEGPVSDGELFPISTIAYYNTHVGIGYQMDWSEDANYFLECKIHYTIGRNELKVDNNEFNPKSKAAVLSLTAGVIF